jgi:hypothetical protein
MQPVKVAKSRLRGAAVAIANLPNGGRAVRDSKDPTGPALVFTAVQWVAFTAGLPAGEFGD